jgi:fructose-1,6-bisphosphatase I
MLLNAICVGCKFLSSAVRRAGIAGTDVLGVAGTANVQGEDQKKLDVVANEVFKNMLRKSGQCALLVSEEEDDPITIEAPYKGEYCVVFDPLDGSSNIECGVSIEQYLGFIKCNLGRKEMLSTCFVLETKWSLLGIACTAA